MPGLENASLAHTHARRERIHKYRGIDEPYGPLKLLLLLLSITVYLCLIIQIIINKDFFIFHYFFLLKGSFETYGPFETFHSLTE